MTYTRQPKIFITIPRFDALTTYLSAWADKLIKSFERSDVDFIVLSGDKVTRKSFEKRLTKIGPDVVLLNGHGDERQLGGQNNDIILDRDNIGLLSGTLVYALSCKVAKILGRDSVKYGVAGFIGYTENFVLMYNNHTARPEKDATAALFLNPSNIIASTLCKGHGVEEATNRGRKAFVDSIKKALDSDTQSDADKYVPWLLQDLRALTCHSSNKEPRRERVQT